MLVTEFTMAMVLFLAGAGVAGGFVLGFSLSDARRRLRRPPAAE